MNTKKYGTPIDDLPRINRCQPSLLYRWRYLWTILADVAFVVTFRILNALAGEPLTFRPRIIITSIVGGFVILGVVYWIEGQGI